MNWQFLNHQRFAENVGWMLIHSLWQISLIAILLFISLRILKNSAANLRYLFCVSALLLAIAMPFATFLSFPAHETAKENLVMENAANTGNSFAQNIESKKKSVRISADPTNIETVEKINSPTVFENIESRFSDLSAASVPYLIWFWFAGMLFFSFRLGGGIWKTQQIKTSKVLFIDEKNQKRFDKLCERIGIRQTVEFIQSEIVETPMVIGWVKPFVIVPASVLTGLNPRELETIIAHELIHIRRHDYLVNILQSFAEIILFFHPFAWGISSQIRRERENACDDAVLEIFDGEPLLYANALANLESFRLQTKNLTPTNAITANGGNLMTRIQRIIKYSSEKNHQRSSVWAAVPAVLIVSTILVTVFFTNGQAVVSENLNQNNPNVKKIAVSLYAASTVIPSENPSTEDEETMQLVIAKLKQHKIPTTGFLKGVKVNVREENIPADQQKIVELWRRAGFEIGVLDLKYPKSFDSTVAEYQTALKRREGKLEPYLKQQMEFFKENRKFDPKKVSLEDSKKRLELLKAMSEQSRNIVKEWMRENNLTSVKYTFGTHDWIYSYTYDVARKENDRETTNRIKASYLDYMAKSLEHYEKYSNYIFERDIPQTMPLTPSNLLADSADELFAMIQNHGYQFVSMDEAMQDDSYQIGPLFSNGTGSSWLETMALERSKPFLDKVNVDLDVLKIWEENQPINRKIIEK